MFEVDGVTYEFHHMGIPTQPKRPGERYSRVYGMYTSDDPCGLLRVQWHRFEPESPLHPLLKKGPQLGGLSGGFLDELGNRVGMRDQREMACLQFVRRGAHPLGHETFEIGIDRPVFC